MSSGVVGLSLANSLAIFAETPIGHVCMTVGRNGCVQCPDQTLLQIAEFGDENTVTGAAVGLLSCANGGSSTG